MKLTILSDTHNRHNEIKFRKGREGSVLLHCGDLTSIFIDKNPAQQLVELDQWFATLPFDKIICVAGNHDYVLQKIPASRGLLKHAVYLEDEAYEYEGVKFYGSPWQLRCGNLGFNADEWQLDSVWARIPNDTDVLITHSPPYGILDGTKYGDKIGSKGLMSKVAQIKPKVHCFGHSHWGRGKKKIDGTHYINAAVAVSYKKLAEPYRIEI
jgi:Icc-related predicted phosphoesterase